MSISACFIRIKVQRVPDARLSTSCINSLFDIYFTTRQSFACHAKLLISGGVAAPLFLFLARYPNLSDLQLLNLL